MAALLLSIGSSNTRVICVVLDKYARNNFGAVASVLIASTLFFTAGEPPLASTLAFQLFIPVQGFLVSIISSDQPPSFFNSFLYHASL